MENTSAKRMKVYQQTGTDRYGGKTCSLSLRNYGELIFVFILGTAFEVGQ